MTSVATPDGAGRPLVYRWAQPVDLDERPYLVATDELTAWIVEAGAIDLFGAREVDGQPEGRWSPLCRLDEGSIFVSKRSHDSAHTIVGRAIGGSVVSIAKRRDFEQIMGDITNSGSRSSERPRLEPLEFAMASATFASGIDAALVPLSHTFREALPPRQFTPIESSSTTRVEAGGSARSIAGVQWVTVIEGSMNLGPEFAGHSHRRGRTVCITERDWIVAERDTTVVSRPTLALMRDRTLWGELDRMATRLGDALDELLAKRANAEVAGALRLRAVTSEQDRLLNETLIPSMLSTDLEEQPAEDARDDLFAARLVATHLGISLPELDLDGEAEAGAIAAMSPFEKVKHLARSAAVRTRTVHLDGRWWEEDLGPMVAQLRSGGGTVALLPRGGGYECVFPLGGRPVKVDRDLSLRLDAEALVFFRPLPLGISSFSNLFRWSVSGAGRDVAQFWISATLAVLLGLVVPILTGTILGSWVSLGRRSLVIQGAAFVMTTALAIGALTYVQNAAVLRIQGRFDLDGQAGVWDRLLSLPVSFFGLYSAADLGTVALGISAVREAMSTVATTVLVAGIAALLNTGLVVYYSAWFGVLLLVVVAVWSAIFWRLWRRALLVQRKAYVAERLLSSMVFQLLNGMATLRVSASEDRAYTRWFHDFVELRTMAVKVRRTQASMTIVNAMVIPVVTLIVFGLVAGPMAGDLSTSDFLTVFVAINVVLGSVLAIFGSTMAIVEVVPTLEEVTPVIAAQPEAVAAYRASVDLEGRIEARDLTFRYQEDGPLILNGVSFTVDPGEFVAIVGSTGSGKSTILRLLLGFESPDSGSVFYDGHELDHLDVTDVRRQCGVVLQGGSLLPGDILTNITGGIGHSVEDAWNAARLAGIADDIKAMPMNMYTYIAEGASTFSGGQAQRLMIARALVSSPRILYFDEATSALDNETQRLVTESTHKLNASRVVIAHRLSTIALADKIVVLDGGRIVQQGTYAGLLADTDGVFARLVGRQLLEEQGAAAETADPESYTLDDLSILAARSEIVDPPDGA